MDSRQPPEAARIARRARLRTDPDPILAQVVGFRTQGLTARRIAEVMGDGWTPARVYAVLEQARRAKLITEDPRAAKAIISERGTPMVVDNILEGLANGDQKYTLRHAEALGIYPVLGKGGSADQGAPTQNVFNLQVVVKMPTDRELPANEVVVGQIVGVPRQLQGAADGSGGAAGHHHTTGSGAASGVASVERTDRLPFFSPDGAAAGSATVADH
jgi:hypothetical protein